MQSPQTTNNPADPGENPTSTKLKVNPSAQESTTGATESVTTGGTRRQKRNPTPRTPLSATLEPSEIAAFGSSLRLVSVERLWSQFAPFGVTLPSFVRFLHTLHIPLLHIGRTRLVDSLSFYLVMRALLRLGRPDFLAPGSLTPQTRDRETTREIPLSSIQKNLESLTRELIYARHVLAPTLHPEKIKELAADVARTIATNIADPAALQAAMDNEANRYALKNAHFLLHRTPRTP